MSFESVGLKMIMAFIIGALIAIEVEASPWEIREKEIARQAQCAEMRTNGGYSVSTKCGVIGSPFGFNLPDDYKAAGLPDGPIKWICTQFEMTDRIVHQCRVDHTNQITVTPAVTWVEYK